MKKILSWVVLVMALGLMGCSYSNGVQINHEEEIKPDSISSSFEYFDGESGSYIELKKDEVVNFNYNIELEEGEIALALFDSEGNEMWQATKSGQKEFKAKENGKYKLEFQFEKAKGSYEIDWTNVTK